MPWLDRTPGGWRVCWRDGGRGAPVHKGMVHATKALAAASLRLEAERLRAHRSLRGGEILTWSALISRWAILRTDKQRSNDYVTSSKRILSNLAERKGWKTASSITPGSIEGLKIHELRAVRTLLRYALAIGQPVDARAIAMAKPRSPRRQMDKLLADDVVETIQAAADKTSQADGLLVHMISTYGHRAEELCRWTWSGVDLEATPPTVTLTVKGGDVHSHPILPQTVARLKRLKKLKRIGLCVLIGDKGRAWRGSAEAAKWIGQCAAGAGVGTIGVLPLRRYAISRMLSLEHNGKPLDAKTVASITGHRTVSLLLNTYARTSERRQSEAIAALGRAPTVLP